MDKLFGNTHPNILRDMVVIFYMIDDYFCGAGKFDKQSEAYRMILALRDAAAEFDSVE